ncbi:hypothetical protein TRICHSKD4_5115 [Roseibium sp. TrichSKD4]|nr:hypothetical protein TRICHSKD4_5115 [Roseibium sp. TrichSKD4]
MTETLSRVERKQTTCKTCAKGTSPNAVHLKPGGAVLDEEA